MFRMKFQSAVDHSGDEEEERLTVGEDLSVSCSPKVLVVEGQVGKFGKARPQVVPSLDKTFPHFADGHASLRSMILSPRAQVVPISSPKPEPAGADDLANLDAKSSPGNDKTTVVAFLHYQDSIRGEARTDDSNRSESSSEYDTPTRRTEDEEDQATTDIIHLKNDKSSKALEEPLLAAHHQEELELMSKEEARVEAKRRAEEERLEREQQLRELRALAHCTTVSPRALERSPTFKKSKLKRILGKTGVSGVYRFLKRPLRIFRFHKNYTGYPDAREAKVVVPKASLFGGCRTVPNSGAIDGQLALMRNAPQPGLTRRPHIAFATVESTQRDVPAWTREEYLRKNGRIPHNYSSTKKEDEEFGGIEGNILMNQYFDDGVLTDYDSDSD